MRRRFLSLPWEMLDPNPAMVTLTYPGRYWRRLVADGRRLDAHRRAFGKRWERRWGPLVGVWSKEFQRSGAPHLHLFVGLPGALPADAVAGLVERTRLGKALEAEHGRYEGRRLTPPLGTEYGGMFAKEIRTAWAEVIGTQGHDPTAWARGVDIRTFYFGRGRERARSNLRVAEYLAGEAAKWQQKRPPAGFGAVGRWWGTYGESLGFVPAVDCVEVAPAVAVALERRMLRWVRLKQLSRRRGRGNLHLRRRGDGVTALGLGWEQSVRLLRYATEAAERGAGRSAVV